MRAKKKLNFPTRAVMDTPRNIWGKVVYYLKQNGFSALHVVCGNIADVKIEENNFIVNIDDEYAYNFINEDNNLSYVKKALAWQELNLNLKIIQKEKQVDKFASDIQKLESLVEKQYLTIKGV